eukprot:5413591-Lingulodinium_polyedra.AAC.1
MNEHGTRGRDASNMRSRGRDAHCRASDRRARAVVVSESMPDALPIARLNSGKAEATFSHMTCTSRSGRSSEAALAIARMA